MVNPDVVEALRVRDAPVVCAEIAPKVIVCATFAMVKLLLADPVAYVASPGVVALRVHVPAAIALTTPKEIVQAPAGFAVTEKLVVPKAEVALTDMASSTKTSPKLVGEITGSLGNNVGVPATVTELDAVDRLHSPTAFFAVTFTV